LDRIDRLSILLFFDERKLTINRRGDSWIYIGMLGVRTRDFETVLRSLLDVRGTVNTEITYKGLNHRSRRKNSRKVKVAREWLEFVKNDNLKIFHFYILGLYWDNLIKEFFDGTEAGVYRRFISTAIRYGVKTFFFPEAHSVEIARIFHDRSVMENDPIFNWRAIWDVEVGEENIFFSNRDILFIDSDHNKETRYTKESHFIQLIDLILGSCTQCLDGLSHRSAKIEVAETIYPLISRLVNEKTCNNRNSRYCYVNRCLVKFFPSKRLSVNELNDTERRATSQFFTNRDLLIDSIKGQVGLLPGF